MIIIFTGLNYPNIRIEGGKKYALMHHLNTIKKLGMSLCRRNIMFFLNNRMDIMIYLNSITNG